MALDDLKAVKNHFGCTVNDVVLALCASALRRYLLAEGELPDEPLVGFVPMSVRTDGERLSAGNRLSAMLTSLATDIADPVERLRTISAGMAEAKSQESLIGADVLTDWTEFTFPALIGRAARLISSMRVFDRVRPAFNVTISNIPGPPFPLFLAGARMVGMYPLGPVVEGAGLNMTVMSYCGDRLLRAERLQGDRAGHRGPAGDDHREPGRAPCHREASEGSCATCLFLATG